MGVTGLLPQLKSIQEPASLSKYKGKRMAVDTYAWLHRGVFSCSWELAQDIDTQKYVHYVLKRIRMLRHFEVEPYMVFDGDHLPLKKATEISRSNNRKEARLKAKLFLEKGQKSKAADEFKKCVDITPIMAKNLIEALKLENVKFIVAPYEADAQMVYLEKLGLVSGIITEDSDLLVFGAKCLFTKLNDYGEGLEIKRENFPKVKELSLIGFNDSQFRAMAILSGCDYTSGINGIGIKKAHLALRKSGTLKRAIISLRLEGKYKVPKDFEIDAQNAEFAFQYQRVYSPLRRKISTLNELPEELKNVDNVQNCIGRYVEDELCQGIATGEIDPISKKPLKYIPSTPISKSFSTIRTPNFNSQENFNRHVNRTASCPTNKNRTTLDSFNFFKKQSRSQTLSTPNINVKPHNTSTPLSLKRMENNNKVTVVTQKGKTSLTSPVLKRKVGLHRHEDSKVFMNSRFFNGKKKQLGEAEAKAVAIDNSRCLSINGLNKKTDLYPKIDELEVGREASTQQTLISNGFNDDNNDENDNNNNQNEVETKSKVTRKVKKGASAIGDDFSDSETTDVDQQSQATQKIAYYTEKKIKEKNNINEDIFSSPSSVLDTDDEFENEFDNFFDAFEEDADPISSSDGEIYNTKHEHHATPTLNNTTASVINGWKSKFEFTSINEKENINPVPTITRINTQTKSYKSRMLIDEKNKKHISKRKLNS